MGRRVRWIYYIHYGIANNDTRTSLKGLARRNFDILTTKTAPLSVQLTLDSWFVYLRQLVQF